MWGCLRKQLRWQPSAADAEEDKGGAGQMKNLIPPESLTDAELDSYVASLEHAAEKTVRHMLAAGAGEAEITDYLADLAAEPEAMLGPPESQPAVRIEGGAIKVPAGQDDRANRNSRAVTSRQRKSQPAVPPNRIPKRRSGKLTEERHDVPPGVQGANTGYWQAGGVTRAGAKRSKRP
jgi:hypothetical protein